MRVTAAPATLGGSSGPFHPIKLWRSTLNKLSKLAFLLHVLPEHPVEFYDRVATVVEVAGERFRAEPDPANALGLAEALGAVGRTLPADIGALVCEPSLLEIEKRVAEGIERLKEKGPFSLGHNADFALGRVCYAICRALLADVVLETGVAFGVTTALVLQALAANGGGKLVSVDLPPLGPDADRYVGYLVPEELRGRWDLRRGITKRLLPKLLPRLGKIDVFIHDSLHTYRNMRFELETVWPFLRPGGVLVADDVGGNMAFDEFTSRVSPASCVVVGEENKNSVFGVLVKQA